MIYQGVKNASRHTKSANMANGIVKVKATVTTKGDVKMRALHQK